MPVFPIIAMQRFDFNVMILNQYLTLERSQSKKEVLKSDFVEA